MVIILILSKKYSKDVLGDWVDPNILGSTSAFAHDDAIKKASINGGYATN